MITIAFYKGRHRGLFARTCDWVTRKVSGGPYSHVELIIGKAELGQIQTCLSSSARDGGVRQKDIFLKANHWDLVEIDRDPEYAKAYFKERMGWKYDFIGLLFSQFFAWGGHSKRKAFCSEACAGALGFASPHHLSPNLLFDAVKFAGGSEVGK